jgi:hypothetical protein
MLLLLLLRCEKYDSLRCVLLMLLLLNNVRWRLSVLWLHHLLLWLPKLLLLLLLRETWLGLPVWRLLHHVLRWLPRLLLHHVRLRLAVLLLLLHARRLLMPILLLLLLHKLRLNLPVLHALRACHVHHLLVLQEQHMLLSRG